MSNAEFIMDSRRIAGKLLKAALAAVAELMKSNADFIMDSSRNVQKCTDPDGSYTDPYRILLEGTLPPGSAFLQEVHEVHL